MPNQTTSQTNNTSGAENINKELDRVIQQINRVNNATEKANSTLKKYINSFNELNKQTKYLQSTTKNLNIKSLNTSSTKQQTQSSNQQVQAKKKELQAAKLVASQLSSTAGKTISLSTALSSSLNPAIGITISSIILLSKLTIDASKNTAEYSKSLRQMGIQLNKLESDSIHTANNINKLKNQVGNVLQDFGEILEPVLNLIVEATSSLLKLAGIDDTETKTKKYGAQADISTSAMQSGFSLNSANALAGGTYNQAIKLAEAYGEQASDVAKKLADAWLNGSEAAKEYGVVVNDQVLTGYMASKGVDIANVEITDAMKQYYRYQLMLEETSASSKSNMQDQIKQWTKLGFIIDKTKGKLFSFDEVIQLTAADATIPEVLGGLINDKDEIKDTSLPILPPSTSPSTPSSTNPSTNPITEPVVVPVSYEVVQPLEIPEPEPVAVPVSIPVEIPGIEAVPGLITMLESLIKLIPLPVSIPVEVPDIEIANNLLTICETLALTPWLTTVGLSIPNLSLAPLLLDYLQDISQEWASKIDITVVGQAVLERAYEVLNNVRSLLNSLGQSVVTTTRKVSTAVKEKGKTALKNTMLNSTAYRNGLAGRTNVNSVASAWAPTSAEAYGGGLKGALKADLDLNLVRLGLKSSTKEGYTTSQLQQATAGYLGYNANQFNKNSLNNILMKSGLGLAGIATAPEVAGASALKSVSEAASAGAKAPIISFPGAASLGLASGFADGGIGTREVNNATLFEGNKKEAVIPLESQAGINYLSNAMKQAQEGQVTTSGDIQVYLTLSGVNIADNEAQWQRVGEKIAEVIEVQRQRRGDLNYGSSF